MAMVFMLFLLSALVPEARSTLLEGFSCKRATEKKTARKRYRQSSAVGSSKRRWIESTRSETFTIRSLNVPVNR